MKRIVWNPMLFEVYGAALRYVAFQSEAPFENVGRINNLKPYASANLVFGRADILVRTFSTLGQYADLISETEAQRLGRNVGEFLVDSVCWTFGSKCYPASAFSPPRHTLFQYHPQDLVTIQEGTNGSDSSKEIDELKQNNIILNLIDVPCDTIARAWVFVVGELSTADALRAAERLSTQPRITRMLNGLYTGGGNGVFAGSTMVTELLFHLSDLFLVGDSIKAITDAFFPPVFRTETFIQANKKHMLPDVFDFASSPETAQGYWESHITGLRQVTPRERRAAIVNLCEQWRYRSFFESPSLQTLAKKLVDSIVAQDHRGAEEVVPNTGKTLERSLRRFFKVKLDARFGADWYHCLIAELAFDRLPNRVEKWSLGQFIDVARRWQKRFEGHLLSPEDLWRIGEFSRVRNAIVHFRQELMPAGFTEREENIAYVVNLAFQAIHSIESTVEEGNC